jgi:hypothetical protein
MPNNICCQGHARYLSREQKPKSRTKPEKKSKKGWLFTNPTNCSHETGFLLEKLCTGNEVRRKVLNHFKKMGGN